MKKLLTLLLAAGMIVSAANGASAVEMKVSGSWLTSFTFVDGLFGKNALLKDSDDGSFRANQQVNLKLDMVMSESLSGTLMLRVADGPDSMPAYQWGTQGVGKQGKAVTARMAYLDWLVPSTDVLVRMGRQNVALPSYAFASPVLDSPIDGVMVNAPINDMVAVNVGWLRPLAEVNAWDAAHTAHSSIDLAYLSMDVAADGFKVTPWGMIGFAGSNAEDGITWDMQKDELKRPNSSYFGEAGPVVDFDGFGPDGKPYLKDANGAPVAAKYVDSRTLLYWVGIGGELTLFDPFKFTADFIYSANDADGYAERDGWYAALGAEMKTSFATPFVKGWYASGDDADSKGSNRMLTVDGEGAFDASSIYFDANGLLGATIDRCDPSGTWGVQAGVKNVSFIEDLTHTFSVTYFQGTNNSNRLDGYGAAWHADPKNVNYMTTKDSAWEIDFLSSYKLYQNFTANLLLAYMITDFDESIRPTGVNNGHYKFDNAFRGTLNFTYAF